MRSHSLSLQHSHHHHHLFYDSGLSRSPKRRSSVPAFLSPLPFLRATSASDYYSPVKLQFKPSKHALRQRRRRRQRFANGVVRVNAVDDDSFGISSYDGWVVDDSVAAYVFSSSSDGEYSDGEIVLNPLTEVELPPVKVSTDEAVSSTARRLALIGRGGPRRQRMYVGLLISLALIIFLTMLLLFVDWWVWRIVRLPLSPFYLTSPFLLSLILAACAGYVCVPLFKSLRLHQNIRKEGPPTHYTKRRTPTMGGLFFIPAGISVADFITGFSSIQVSAASLATLSFAAIGLLDDVLSFVKQHNGGLSPWLRLVLEAAVGIWFSFWLNTTSLSSPYGMKMLIPLPAPLGLMCLGKFYLLLTSFCFVSMGNGVNLTDGLDGLAGGTAALSFIGMSIAVLPICPELGIFGASMAGACAGFLLHNRYKASIFMGDVGSLAIGGALAAMAACTGMFFPLFISSGFFVLEASSVIMQVLYFKTTKHLQGRGRHLFRMAPFHHHLELCGFREPMIVAGAYIVSCVLALFAGYIGLVSA